MDSTTESRPPVAVVNAQLLDHDTVAKVMQADARLLQNARRYSCCAADAEDAYQRGLEILITKAPCSDAKQLVPWLMTVIKNEALTIARRNQAHQTDDLDALANELASREDGPEEKVARLMVVAHSGEAMGRLSVDALRCILLMAEGHSHAEMVTITGFSSRKVERCVVVGRKLFRSRVNDIESGAECERIDPLLQRAVDGDIEALTEARRHLRSCGYCRAVMREYREAPARLVVAWPIGLMAAPDVGGHIFADLFARAESAVTHFAYAVTQRVQEVSLTTKAGAAVTATAVAVGTPLAIQKVDGGDKRGDEARVVQSQPVADAESKSPTATAPASPTTPQSEAKKRERAAARRDALEPALSPEGAARTSPVPATQPPATTDDGSDEAGGDLAP